MLRLHPNLLGLFACQSFEQTCFLLDTIIPQYLRLSTSDGDVEFVAVAIVGAVELTTSSNPVRSSGAVAEEYPSQLSATICTSFHGM